MLKIDQVSWAKISVSGNDFFQVLLLGQKVIERDVDKLRKLFGTSHQVGSWEWKRLLEKGPEIILIGNGWEGALKVDEEAKKKVISLGIELKILITPKAVEEYNQLVKSGKRVNALIHTTC
jgi:hypothetical protein